MINISVIKEYIGTRIDNSHLSKSELEKDIEGMISNIATAVNIAILEQLDNNDKIEFLKLVQLSDDRKILKFVNSKIINPEVMVNETTDKIIDEYNNLVKAS